MENQHFMNAEHRFHALYREGKFPEKAHPAALVSWLEARTRMGRQQVLDLGCGDLEWVSRCEAITQGKLAYRGLDIVPSLIAHHRRIYPWFSGEVADIETPSVRPADIVILKDVLCYLCNGAAEQILQNIAAWEWDALIVSHAPGSPPEARRNLRDERSMPFDVVGSGLIPGEPTQILQLPDGEQMAVYEHGGKRYDLTEDFSQGENEISTMRAKSAPSKLTAFYMVCAMGNWKEVVEEQCEVFQRMGLKPKTYLIGDAEDVAWLRGKEDLEVIDHSGDKDNTLYETPALQHLYQWAMEHPKDAVMYVHSKGVSQPDDEIRVAWRRLMSHYVVEQWPENLKDLATHDAVGLNWIRQPRFPHFSGNFWMARNDYISRLKDPMDYRMHGGPRIAGGPWARMNCEMWIGSSAEKRIKSLCCSGVRVWENGNAQRLLDEALQKNSHKH